LIISDIDRRHLRPDPDNASLFARGVFFFPETRSRAFFFAAFNVSHGLRPSLKPGDRRCPFFSDKGCPLRAMTMAGRCIVFVSEVGLTVCRRGVRFLA